MHQHDVGLGVRSEPDDDVAGFDDRGVGSLEGDDDRFGADMCSAGTSTSSVAGTSAKILADNRSVGR